MKNVPALQSSGNILSEALDKLSNTKKTIQFTYGYGKSVEIGTPYIRHYTQQEYTFVELSNLIKEQLQNFDTPIAKPKIYLKQKRANDWEKQTTRDGLMQEVITYMKSMIRHVKRDVVETHTKEYMTQNNIPEVPTIEKAYRDDSFIHQYCSSSRENNKGLPYGVIAKNPFGADANEDIKLLVSQIWSSTCAIHREQKYYELCKSIHQLLGGVSTIKDNNCKNMHDEIIKASFGFHETGNGRSQSIGNTFERPENNSDKIERTFYYIIDGIEYVCDINNFNKYKTQLINLQKEIPQDIRFDTGFNSPTGGRYYISSEENFKKLGIRHLFKGGSDRSYRLPDTRFEQAMDSILTTPEKELFQKYDQQVKLLEGEIALFYENRKRQEKILKVLEESKNVDKQEILKQMPAFIEHLMKVEYASSIQVNTEYKVASYIRGYSDYNGSGGSEYGLYITVRYDGMIKQEKVVYRDRYDEKKDDRSLNFNKLLIKNIDHKIEQKKLQVSLEAKNDQRTKPYAFTFDIKEIQPKETLSKEQQENFLKLFTEKKTDTLHTKGQKYQNSMMPFYCVPNERQVQGMPTDDRAYERPTIVSEAIDQQTGRGVFVVKMQIDHSAGSHKMQREREAYSVKANGEIHCLQRECRRRNEIQGGNGVSMNANDIIQEMQ